MNTFLGAIETIASNKALALGAMAVIAGIARSRWEE